MSDILEPIVYLSQEVGPRPAGTEEEQQAALYITEAISKEAGLSTVIEDFRGIASPAPILALLCLVAVVISVVSTAFPVIDLASVIVTAIVAIIYFTEAFDKPILSRLMSRGVSQNVVVKYEPHLPSESGASHPRKVVLVARYDSGKVSRETSKGLVKILPILQWFTLISVIALPILLLLRTIFFSFFRSYICQLWLFFVNNCKSVLYHRIRFSRSRRSIHDKIHWMEFVPTSRSTYFQTIFVCFFTLITLRLLI